MAEDEGMFIGGRGGNPRTVAKSTSTLGNRFRRCIPKGDWRKPVVGDRYRAPLSTRFLVWTPNGRKSVSATVAAVNSPSARQFRHVMRISSRLETPTVGGREQEESMSNESERWGISMLVAH